MGFPGFGLWEESMQRAGSKDGDSDYTESDREVQDGNSGWFLWRDFLGDYAIVLFQ
jgi:hypothetical protein